MPTDPYADLPILDMDEFQHVYGGYFRSSVVEPALSTIEDIDSRTGERRLLVDDYRLHADHVDVIRLAFMDQIPRMIELVDHADDLEKLGAEYWYDELWTIDRACRALGIED